MSTIALTTHFSTRYEFGGPGGVLAIMTGFPILMYYLWICLVFYDGQLALPHSLDDVGPFLGRMWEHIYNVSCSYSPAALWLCLICSLRMQIPTQSPGRFMAA